MKTKELLFLFLLLFISSCAKKQHEPLPTQGLLWKISGNGLKTPSYLFGTYHDRGGMQILDSIKNFDSIFNSTEQFLCESKSDFSNVQKPTLSLEQLIKPWPVADSTYGNILSSRQKIVLDSFLLSEKNLSDNIRHLNTRPLSLLGTIKFSLNVTRIKRTKDYKPCSDTIFVFLDGYLQYKAKKRGINIVALDSQEEFNKISEAFCCGASQLSYKEEVGYLMNYIENHAILDSTKKAKKATVLSAYLKQDIQQVNDLGFYDPISPVVQNLLDKCVCLLVDERNSNWIRKIPALMLEKSCFIAVGNGHLGGQKGLIKQLRNLGYTVESLYENTKLKQLK